MRKPHPAPDPSGIPPAGSLGERLTDLISAELSLGEILPAVCKLTAEHLRADTVTLALSDGDLLRVASVYSAGDMHPVALPPIAKAALVMQTSVRSADKAGVFLAVPLRSGAAAVGVLVVQRASGPPIGDAERSDLEDCVPLVVAAINIAADSIARNELAILSLTDALTGVGNRRKFDQALSNEWKRCARLGTPLALLLLDVDHFKAYNDRYGHIAGDACLRNIAHACAARIVRAGDTFARYGGEEFAAILPNTGESGAVVVAEEIRAQIGALDIEHQGSALRRVSVSIGVATLIPTEDLQPDTLVARADANLYEAKRDGRNRVAGETLKSSGPPAQLVLSMAGSNVPTKLTQFFGREHELSELRQLLERSRLLTVAGPGGVGKTRIALEIARPLAGRKPVWFADLTTVSEPGAVGAAVCNAAGVKLGHAEAAGGALAAQLGNEAALMILDNCEHIIDACAQVAAELLSACPGLQILATTREPLGVDGENIYRLSVLSDDDAVRLFAERAKIARPEFALTADNTACVARICRRLDGIPLAIELAGPRLAALTLTDLEKALNDRIGLLTGGRRTAFARQRTLESLIRWGYELLTPDEQRVLGNVSVFVGAWPVSAAVAIDGTLDSFDMLTVIGSLVDKSLLFVEPARDENRYRLLESTREFAALRLAESGHGDAVRRRHIAHYQDMLARLRDDPAQLEAYAARDYANIRAALVYAFENKLDEPAGIDLALNLGDFWRRTFEHGEALRWTDRALECAGGDGASYRSLAMQLAFSLMQIHDLERAEQLCRPLVEAPARAADPAGYRRALRAIAGCSFMRGEYSAAKDHMLELLNDPIDDPNELSAIYSNLGGTYAHLGMFDDALKYSALSLDSHSGKVTNSLLAVHTSNHVSYLLCLGRVDEALPLIEDILKLPESVIGMRSYLQALIEYAQSMLIRGDGIQARERLRSAAAACFQTIRANRMHSLGGCVSDLVYFSAIYAFGQQDYVTALQLFGFVRASSEITAYNRLKPNVEQREKMIDSMRASIDEASVAENLTAGEKLTLAQVETIVLSL